MKKYLVLAFAAFMAFSFSFAQSANEDPITVIDKKVTDISSNLKKLNRQEKYNNEKGSKYIYRRNNDPRYIHEIAKGNDVNKEVHWYFDDQNELMYAEQIRTKPNGQDIVAKDRFYFHKGELIKWLKSGTEAQPGSKEFVKANEDFKAQAKKLRME